MNLSQTHLLAIKQIVREVYNDLPDLGAILDYIQPNTHTADFELSEGLKMRCMETKQGVYYNIFREK